MIVANEIQPRRVFKDNFVAGQIANNTSGGQATSDWSSILNVPVANASQLGVLSSTDWNTFNAKQNALSYGTLAVGSNLGISGGNNALVGGGATISLGANVVTGVSATNISASIASNVLTISIPQSVATTATPTFAGATLNGALAMGTNPISSVGAITSSGVIESNSEIHATNVFRATASTAANTFWDARSSSDDTSAGIFNFRTMKNNYTNITNALVLTENTAIFAGNVTASAFITNSGQNVSGVAKFGDGINYYAYFSTGSNSADYQATSNTGYAGYALALGTVGNGTGFGSLITAGKTVLASITGSVTTKNNTLDDGSGNAAFAGNINQTGITSIFYNNYTSGILGTGFQIARTSNGTFLEIDNITIRNTLRTHIFQKDVVKVSNGYLYISDSGIISGATSGSIKFKASKSASFTSGMQLWIKDANENTGSIISVKVTLNDNGSTTGDETTYTCTYTLGVYTDLSIGMTAARISGGTILLDSSSTYAPFIDFSDGTSVRTRAGNLAGKTSTAFGVLTGFGVWADNLYAEGNIKIVGTLYALGSGAVGTSTMAFGKDAGGSGNHGLFVDINNYWYNSGSIKIGGANGINYAGSGNVTIGTNVVISGSLNAATGTFAGSLTAATGSLGALTVSGAIVVGSGGSISSGSYYSFNNVGGSIAGWNFDATKIYKGTGAGADYIGMQATTGSGIAFFAGATDAVGTGAAYKVLANGALYSTSGLIANINIASDKLYIGAGTYATSDTVMYIGASGISLTDKYKVDTNGVVTFSGSSKTVYDATGVSIFSGTITQTNITTAISVPVFGNIGVDVAVTSTSSFPNSGTFLVPEMGRFVYYETKTSTHFIDCHVVGNDSFYIRDTWHANALTTNYLDYPALMINSYGTYGRISFSDVLEINSTKNILVNGTPAQGKFIFNHITTQTSLGLQRTWDDGINSFTGFIVEQGISGNFYFTSKLSLSGIEITALQLGNLVAAAGTNLATQLSAKANAASPTFTGNAAFGNAAADIFSFTNTTAATASNQHKDSPVLNFVGNSWDTISASIATTWSIYNQQFDQPYGGGCLVFRVSRPLNTKHPVAFDEQGRVYIGEFTGQALGDYKMAIAGNTWIGFPEDNVTANFNVIGDISQAAVLTGESSYFTKVISKFSASWSGDFSGYSSDLILFLHDGSEVAPHFYEKFRFDSDGKIWFNGTATTTVLDTNLYRSAGGVLRTNGAVIVDGVYINNDGSTYGWAHGNLAGSNRLYWNGNNTRFEFVRANNTNYADIAGGTYTNASDISLKTNIVDIVNPMEILRKIRGVTCDWRDGHAYNQPVFIAQEIEKVLPSIVSYSETMKLKSVSYDNVIPILVEGVKRVDSRLLYVESETDLLKSKVKNLEKELNDLKQRYLIN